MTIRSRLATGVALLTLLVVLVVSGVQYAALRSFLTVGERERLSMLLPQLEGRLDRPDASRSSVLSGLPRTVDVRVLRAGSVYAQTPDFPPLPATLPPGFRHAAGHEVLVGTAVVEGQPGFVQLASDALGTVNPLRSYLQSLTVVAPVSVGLAWLLSYLLAGLLLAPLRRLERSAEAVGRDGEWRRALPGAGRRDELGRLAGVLQRVFTQIADLREREALFTQAAAHDLRSPLTAVKARLQGALVGPRGEADLRDDITEALVDVERVRRLSEHLLLLAQGEHEVQWQAVDLSDLAGRGVDRAREAWPDVQLDFGTRGNVTVKGDATLLAQLVENLLENAMQYGQGAPVLVSVTGAEDGVTLQVRDAGPGVPVHALPHLRQPFYRLDPARRGPRTGLGLAIVERIAVTHRAVLTLRSEGGLDVQVTFPPAGASGS
ncbi:sensor histidine kinase [Deinococcus aquiradiocola]|uniref:histidine kinase n=1 Tax=Deinococcus aquiradiocola TaxID=393059 RepID=A0A917UMF1_9DEIO|nr:HAMP domain-containing sensor histidine kinase [Deinococcus aquiradiocola]GGJ67902.1 two-component sensor histidine kinase [Deinococcus aquiradiocola]